MTIPLPHTFVDGPGNTASGVQVNENFNALVSAIEGVGSAAAGTDLYQAGVVEDADWKPTATNINPSTGVLELTNFGGNAWLPGPVSGLVRTFLAKAAVGGLKPALPGPGGFIRAGIEVTASGSSAVVSVVTGIEKATQVEAEAIAASPGVSSGKLRVLDVIIKNVGAVYSVVTTRDRRSYALGLQRLELPGTDTTSSVSFTVMPNPDEVEVTVPTGGLIQVGFQAQWQETVAAAGRAALFIGGNQLKAAFFTGGTSAASFQEADTQSGSANVPLSLASFPGGLVSVVTATPYTGDVTTGQAVGVTATGALRYRAATVAVTEAADTQGGLCTVFAAAGTYRISVRYRATSGSVSVAQRKLWARVLR